VKAFDVVRQITVGMPRFMPFAFIDSRVHPQYCACAQSSLLITRCIYFATVRTSKVRP
jgi:hypothetical protein